MLPSPLFVALLGLSLAQEAGDPVAWRGHQDAAARAAEAERGADPAAAVAACDEALAVLPDGPRAGWCVERRAFLDARRDPDGGFRGWRALEEARRSGADRGAQRAAIEALVAGEGVAEATRREAWGWLADDALRRQNDPEEALRWSAPLIALPDLPLDERRRYRIVHARALAALGRWDEARAVEAEVLVLPTGRRPSPVDQAARDVRRRGLAEGAAGVLGALVLTAAARAGVRRPVGGARGWGPLAVGLLGAGGILVAWDASNVGLFATVAAGLAITHALAYAAGSGPGAPVWVRVLAALAAPAVVVASLAWHQRLEEIGW
jgi:hypothetical protein